MKLWATKPELDALATTGPAYQFVQQQANLLVPEQVKIGFMDSNTDQYTLAAALVAAKGDGAKRVAVVQALDVISRTLDPLTDNRLLGPLRNLAPYVIAADLINYRGPGFIHWLYQFIRAPLSDAHGKSIIGCHELRPNNFGLHAFAARVAADLYLDDTADLTIAIQTYKDWASGKANRFSFDDDLSWHPDRAKLYGVNPPNSRIFDHNVDGVLPDDMQRGGAFKFPFPKTGDGIQYSHGAASPLLCAITLLARNGYPDAPSWGSEAPLRIYRWLYTQANAHAYGDYRPAVDLLHYLYGSAKASFATLPPSPSQLSKSISFTDWWPRGKTLQTTPAPSPGPVPEPTDPCSGVKAALVKANADLTEANVKITSLRGAVEARDTIIKGLEDKLGLVRTKGNELIAALK